MLRHVQDIRNEHAIDQRDGQVVQPCCSRPLLSSHYHHPSSKCIWLCSLNCLSLVGVISGGRTLSCSYLNHAHQTTNTARSSKLGPTHFTRRGGGQVHRVRTRVDGRGIGLAQCLMLGTMGASPPQCLSLTIPIFSRYPLVRSLSLRGGANRSPLPLSAHSLHFRYRGTPNISHITPAAS